MLELCNSCGEQVAFSVDVCPNCRARRAGNAASQPARTSGGIHVIPQEQAESHTGSSLPTLIVRASLWRNIGWVAGGIATLSWAAYALFDVLYRGKSTPLAFLGIIFMGVCGILAVLYNGRAFINRAPALTFSSITLTDHRFVPPAVIYWSDLTQIGMTSGGYNPAIIHLSYLCDGSQQQIDIDVDLLQGGPNRLHQLVQIYAAASQRPQSV